MARRTKEQLLEAKATAKHYLAMTNNDPQKAWNEYIKAHLLSGKPFTVQTTLKEFVNMAEEMKREQEEREAFFRQCDKEREAAQVIETDAQAIETDAQYIARLLTLPKETLIALWSEYKTTRYRDAVATLCMAHSAQDARGICWREISQLKEIVS